jgi:YD repeat-containing protein
MSARGVPTMHYYDLYGNLTQKTVGGIAVMSATYDYLGGRLTEADGNGNTSTFTYSLTGQIRTVTNALGHGARHWRDAMGNLTRSLDSLGRETVNAYDGWGRLRSETRQASGGAQAISRSARYDVLGNPVYAVDERGHTTQYAYDKLSRVTAAKNALNQTGTAAYDADGNKVSEADWLGNANVYRYDILDRLIASIDPNNVQAETLTYTDTNLQATSTDALSHTTTYTYDALGRLTSTTDAAGHTTGQTYDSVGNVASRTDGNGNVTSYAYDGLDRLTGVSAGGATTSYTYDAAGNTLSQTDGRGNATSWEYNALNLPTLRADPGGIVGAAYDETRIERHTYRADGKLLTSRDKNGEVTAYAYDIHGRKTTETVGGDAIAYQYDAAGNLLSVSDASGAITRTYDALGRVASKTAPTFGTATFAYDVTAGLPAGFVGESTTIDGRAATRVYDKAGRLAQVRDGAATTGYAYYANGSLQTQTLPNGVTASYAYYADSRLHTLQNRASGGATLEAYQYAYDGAGNLTAKQDIKGARPRIHTRPVTSSPPSASPPAGTRRTHTTLPGTGRARR